VKVYPQFSTILFYLSLVIHEVIHKLIHREQFHNGPIEGLRGDTSAGSSVVGVVGLHGSRLETNLLVAVG